MTHEQLIFYFNLISGIWLAGMPITFISILIIGYKKGQLTDLPYTLGLYICTFSIIWPFSLFCLFIDSLRYRRSNRRHIRRDTHEWG